MTVPMGWEEPELQDQPVCKQLCLFFSDVSGFLWAQFPPCLAPKHFTQPICPFPHIEKGHGLLGSLCGPWGCLGGRLPTSQNHLAHNSLVVGHCSTSVLSEKPCFSLGAGACPHLPGIPLWMTKVIQLHTQLEASASCPEGPDLSYHELFADCLGTAKSTSCTSLCTSSSITSCHAVKRWPSPTQFGNSLPSCFGAL